MGFCRTNLFKRLESGGPAFIQSLERHVLRNFIFLYAIENNLELPIGTQNADLLDTRTSDEDNEIVLPETVDEGDASAEDMTVVDELAEEEPTSQSETSYRKKAEIIYHQYATQFRKRFKWIRPVLFNSQLKKDLLQDARKLLQILNECGKWEMAKDAKLMAMVDLLTQKHPNEKILIFTQFADTVHYLTSQLQACGLTAVEGITGDSEDPTATAWRFSPVSNGKRRQVQPEEEIRILIATDVLSEGQNLQDAAIVVNYDLPWAIIRLIQRAGRVDRIG